MRVKMTFFLFKAQKAYVVNWFSKNELNLVFGLIASVALLVSICNNIDSKARY